MAEREIKIATRNGFAMVVPVLVRGVWAAHRIHTNIAADREWFKVTHVPSGIAIPTDYSEEIARDVAAYLGELCPRLGERLRFKEVMSASDTKQVREVDAMFRMMADMGMGIKIEKVPNG